MEDTYQRGKDAYAVRNEVCPEKILLSQDKTETSETKR